MSTNKSPVMEMRDLVDAVRALPTEKERFEWWDCIMTQGKLDAMSPAMRCRMNLVRLYACLDGDFGVSVRLMGNGRFMLMLDGGEA